MESIGGIERHICGEATRGAIPSPLALKRPFATEHVLPGQTAQHHQQLWANELYLLFEALAARSHLGHARRAIV